MQKDNLKSAASGGLSRTMGNMRLKAKLGLFIGLVVVMVTGVTIAGNITRRDVAHIQTIADDAGSIATYVLEARRQVKTFQIYGFAVRGDETQNPAEKFHCIITHIERQLEELMGKLYKQEDIDAIAAISENITPFNAAFDEMLAAHKEKDGAFADWARVGWAVTEVIDHSMEEIIDPARASAQELGDLNAFAEWTYIGKHLDEHIIQPFLLMRVTGATFVATEADRHWAAYEQQVSAALAGVAKWATLVQGHPDLEAAPAEIASYLEEHAKAGERFRAAVLATRNATTTIDTAGINIQQDALNLEATKTEEAIAQESSAATMILGGSLLAIVLGIGVGVVITRAITKPVASLQQVAEQIAGGDTQITIDIDQKDEIGQLADSMRGAAAYMKEIATAAESIADGDLTVSVQPKSEKDVLGNAFSRMIGNLRQLIGKASTSANQLNAASDQLATAANQAGEATQQVAGTSQQMATGAADQAESSQETTKSVGQLTEVIDQIARGAEEQSSQVQKAAEATSEASSGVEQVATGAAAAAEGSRKAAEAARNGAEMTRKTVTGMEKIRATVDVASEKVTDLGKRSEQIDKIVSVISDIAAQTNLLALNAAIEAARAGEHGRGFAVVADEVRKLAERSSAATQEIADLIASIQTGVKESVKSMEEGTSEVKEGFRLASEAGNALEEILKASMDVSEQIEQISAGAQQSSASASELLKLVDSIGSVSEENMAATEQMSAGATEVSRSIESVAGIAEQNSAATQQVSASAEEMSAQVEEIVASSQSLKQMSEELQEAVSKFNLNGAGAGAREKSTV